MPVVFTQPTLQFSQADKISIDLLFFPYVVVIQLIFHSIQYKFTCINQFRTMHTIIHFVFKNLKAAVCTCTYNTRITI